MIELFVVDFFYGLILLIAGLLCISIACMTKSSFQVFNKLGWLGGFFILQSINYLGHTFPSASVFLHGMSFPSLLLTWHHILLILSITFLFVFCYQIAESLYPFRGKYRLFLYFAGAINIFLVFMLPGLLLPGYLDGQRYFYEYMPDKLLIFPGSFLAFILMMVYNKRVGIEKHSILQTKVAFIFSALFASVLGFYCLAAELNLDLPLIKFEYIEMFVSMFFIFALFKLWKSAITDERRIGMEVHDQLIVAEEKERIGNNLHDGTIQSLHGLAIYWIDRLIWIW